MFTGTIKNLGMIVDVRPLSRGLKFCIISSLKLEVGTSISCSGVCMTVVAVNVFYFKVEA